jgi:hypothetical protein
MKQKGRKCRYNEATKQDLEAKWGNSRLENQISGCPQKLF